MIDLCRLLWYNIASRLVLQDINQAHEEIVDYYYSVSRHFRGGAMLINVALVLEGNLRKKYHHNFLFYLIFSQSTSKWMDTKAVPENNLEW